MCRYCYSSFIGSCEECRPSAEQIAAMKQDKAHDNDELCEVDGCQKCCPHDERDHGICLDCGHEEDPGAAIDRAMDSMEDR